MNSETSENEVKNLSDIFPPELVEYYKQNKNLITEELLDTLRTYGNDGKALALEILDTPMDDEKYHLDAFGNRIFFNGNRQLKRPFTKMPIAKIHEIEIKKCADDIYYFMDNYIRITTPKGLNFPELREYQREFISVINKQENEKIISLQPRQSGKSVTVGIWILHVFLFQKDLTIGIASNKLAMSKEFVDKIKKMFLTVPMWLQCGILNWNVATIEGENRIKILSDTASDSSFRGFSCLNSLSVLHLTLEDKNCLLRNVNNSKDFKLKDYINESRINNIAKQNKRKHRLFKNKKLQLKKLNQLNQSKFIKNTLFKVPTPNGFQSFKGFLKSKDRQGLRINFDDNTFVSCTKTHLIKISENLFIEAQYLKINDIISNKKIIKISNQNGVFYDLFEVQGHQYIVNDIIHHNCNYLVVDECVSYNEIIEIKNKTTGQIRKIKIGEFEEEIRLKEKIFNNLLKLNPSNVDKIVEYINFVIDNKTTKEKYKTDEHHILPKNKDCFPEYTNENWNKIHLSYKNHFIAHKLLYEALPNNKRIVFAFYAMLNKMPKFKGHKENYDIVTPDEYQLLKEKSVAYLKEINSGFVMAVKNGKNVRITKEEFDNNRELYQTPSDNLFTVIDIKTNQKIRILKDDYNPKIHRIHTKGVATYLNLKTLKKERIDISERKEYHLYNNQLITIKRNNEIIEGVFVRDCNFETDIFICKYHKKRIRIRKRKI